MKQYKIWYPVPLTYTAWDNTRHTKTWLEIMQLYTNCAFMQRWDGDRLDVAKLLDKMGVTIE